MKPLKPSHREHKRYLLLSGKDANPKEIDEAILKFLGILGYAEASPEIIKMTGKSIEKNRFNNKIVLAINRKSIEKIRSSLLLSGKDIHIEKISGTINKL